MINILVNSNEFIEYIIREIKRNGVRSNDHDAEEIEDNVIDMIENAHEDFIKEKGN